MTVIYEEYPDTKTVELTVNGKITREDFDMVAPRLEHFIEASDGKIKIIEIIPELKGFEPSLLWEGLKFDAKHLKNISHCAVVSDIGWVSPFSKFCGAFMKADVKTFDLAHLDAARAWIHHPEPVVL